MRVFFNHLAKCGGTTIYELAKREYKENAHKIYSNTSYEEVKKWLNKDRVFISGELINTNRAILDCIINDIDLTKITISRDPIERFKSFCGHSTRGSLAKHAGVSYWGSEFLISQPISAKNWLEIALKRFETMIILGEDRYKDNLKSTQELFPIYSQWLLGSMLSIIDPKSKTFSDYGGRIDKHVLNTRRIIHELNFKPEIYFPTFTHQFYTILGTTDKLNEFTIKLLDHGIFKNRISSMPIENSSQLLQRENQEVFNISDSLISQYFAIAPEDFYFHYACRI